MAAGKKKPAPSAAATKGLRRKAAAHPASSAPIGNAKVPRSPALSRFNGRDVGVVGRKARRAIRGVVAPQQSLPLDPLDPLDPRMRSLEEGRRREVQGPGRRRGRPLNSSYADHFREVSNDVSEGDDRGEGEDFLQTSASPT
ncbi:peptide abc transporter atp-binding protein [Lasius niger]|uniref:Peptide abc transporter atp-binding protein n=1 Tax=Lasius niger TaxID=67767 RepID=A0A0J7KI06_LASNI|nr:peptide abc transporter atp-binding protein [Lasius niger]